MATATEPASRSLTAYPIDPAFPQLEAASDPGTMLEIFRRHLSPTPGREPRILDCAPSRFRCRQSATRCVLQYTLRVAESDASLPWSQWVTGFLHANPGESERVARTLGAASSVRQVPERWRAFAPVSRIPELDMVAVVFPFDRRLPQLARLMNGGARDIARLLVDRLGPGRWHTTTPALRPARYRTELGAVLRMDLMACESWTGRIEEPSGYLKVYRDDRGRRTHELLRSWQLRDRQSRRPYALVRPIAYLEELRTLILEVAPGTPLRDRLCDGPGAEAAVRAVARGLAAFHQDDVEIATTETLAEHLERVERAAQLAQWACPEKRVKIAGVAAVVAEELREVHAAPIHGDLKPEHVHLEGDRAIFVDADSVTRGDPLRDVAQLVAHLAGHAEPGPPEGDRARALAAAFTDEYFEHVPSAWRAGFRYQCAAAFIEVAAGIFRSQGAGWRDRLREAASSARHSLAGEFG